MGTIDDIRLETNLVFETHAPLSKFSEKIFSIQFLHIQKL